MWSPTSVTWAESLDLCQDPFPWLQAEVTLAPSLEGTARSWTPAWKCFSLAWLCWVPAPSLPDQQLRCSEPARCWVLWTSFDHVDGDNDCILLLKVKLSRRDKNLFVCQKTIHQMYITIITKIKNAFFLWSYNYSQYILGFIQHYPKCPKMKLGHTSTPLNPTAIWGLLCKVLC